MTCWVNHGKTFVKNTIGEQIAGVFDFVVSPFRKDSLGASFNKQVQRKALFNELVESVVFDSIVETGTFKGATSTYMHRETGLPVYTVELSPRYYRFAKIRSLFQPGISVSLGDSRAFLYTLARNMDTRSQNIFFYLDAHWNEELPLWEEIDIIVRRWSCAVLMVDDFKVPNDTGYRYDDYGKGCSLTLDNLLSMCISASALSIFFPSAGSRLETGGKRGCVILTNSTDLANSIRGIPLLKEWGSDRRC